MQLVYRLGLDLGTNSIGWTMVNLDAEGKPVGIRRMGTRIFSDGRDPKSGQTLAADRTSVRGQRTRRDRAIRRRDQLLINLCRLGLLPQDAETARKLATLDPYELRAVAPQKPLHPFHLGRALMHLAKRRGFQSNRRTPAKDAEGNTKEAMKRLHEQLAGQTLGQFLFRQIAEGKGARFRPSSESAGNPKKDFPLYPERAMYKEEFTAIREGQRVHQKLTDADWEHLQKLIFFQRELRVPERGKCRFLAGESRASLALPSFQQFRLLSDANHLGYRPSPFEPVQPLNAAQRAVVLSLTRTQKTVGFDKLRTKLKLPDSAQFNLESDKRPHLLGDPVAALFAGKKLFGSRWHELPLAERDDIVAAVLDLDDHDALRRVGERHGLADAALDEFSNLNPDDLPRGTARFSATALRLLVPQLEKGLKYSEAVAACGWSHTTTPEDGSAPLLPYYGKAMPDSVVPVPKTNKVADEVAYGRFPNPTVHIALNQLRVVVNALIDRYGKPAEINLELARDLKMSAKQKAELEKIQNDNTKENRRRDEFIDEINATFGAKLAKNYNNRLRVRLWQELATGQTYAHCPYTGLPIPKAKLFTDEVEIDHILPFGATCDDSPANKILCLRSANRAKRKRSPYEAFGHNPDGYDYGAILARAAFLPGNKRWRFQADAMEKFRDEARFQARQLVDTQHLGRAAHRYLSCIVPPAGIRVSPGRITALLRHHWGLETILAPGDAPDRGGKNRADHRHHAIDALVVALLDHRLLHFIRTANAAEDLNGIEVPPPWKSFRTDAAAEVDKIVVSHRPDHNPAGRLHEDTAYGEVLQDRARRRPNQQWEIDKGYNLVVRKPVAGLKSSDIERVRDLALRQKLAAALHGISETDKSAWASALSIFSATTKTKTIRLVTKDKSARRVTHGGGRFARRLIPGDIHAVCFWLLPNGEPATTYMSVWDANTPNATWAKPHPAAKKLFVVSKGDALTTVHKGEEKLVRVAKLQPSETNRNIVCVAAKSATDEAKFTVQFSRILITKTRLVHVSPIGDVRDPGPLA
ncbi:type II CRISPR RNA-guided endonuclease Cas9 [Novosphingobium sp.]|uniref:type II CRISPR RNA-guided endonuclease Cas9 n=1 Tax=Novosphingobium sp. TaxID=1874826 RepID=UPI00261BBDD4|nr:type II CRISPR RNA-guided endonuclease Cas9 [Novosphingobium sp.]